MSNLNNETISIYLGKACNLRCFWCYDQANQCESIDFNKFQRFYNTIIKDHIENIILIGGEPLVYSCFFDVINLLRDKKIIIVSNGIQLSNHIFFDQVSKFKNISFSLSLKGYNKDSFKVTTNIDCFSDLSKALTTLSKSDIKASYSYVFDSKMKSDDYEQFLQFCNFHSIKHITIGEIRPYVDSNGNIINYPNDKLRYEEFINYLIDNGIDVIAKIQFPLCLYSSDFISRLSSNKKLITMCSVKRGGALVFNSNLDLILCDACHDICLGSFEKDFYNYDSLNDLFFSKSIRKVYNLFSGCPYGKCLDCEKWEICGGGCILNWRKYGT